MKNKDTGETKDVVGYFKNPKGEMERVPYAYFLPSFLNREYRFASPEIYMLNEDAARNIAELNAHSKDIQHVDVFLNMILRNEAVKSSSIEGTCTTFDEIVLPENQVEPSKRDDRQEVFNYLKASWHLQDDLNKRPVCLNMIKDLHSILLKGTRGDNKRPGKVRDAQNWIGGNTIKSAKFVPPAPEELDALMSDLEKFWHNEKIRLPYLIKMALFHYQFETIHPFADGNGRIGRLLILAQLLEAKFLDKPWFNVSVVFERNKANYTESLNIANKTGDIEQWVIFFLDSLISAAKSTSSIYHQFKELQNKCNDKIIKLKSRAQKGQKLLDELYQTPFITVNEVKKLLNVEHPAANRLVADFVKMGILYQVKEKKRDRLFVFFDYIRIFNEM